MDEDRLEQDRQDREVREAERERAFDHTPVAERIADRSAALIPLHELPVQGGSWGMGLWARVREPDDPLWSELDDGQRRMWGRAERFVWHHERMRRKPGPLRFELEPGEPVAEYERHVEAVEAVLRRTLPALFSWVTDEWLRETAEAVLAAAETGI